MQPRANPARCCRCRRCLPHLLPLRCSNSTRGAVREVNPPSLLFPIELYLPTFAALKRIMGYVPRIVPPYSSLLHLMRFVLTQVLLIQDWWCLSPYSRCSYNRSDTPSRCLNRVESDDSAVGERAGKESSSSCAFGPK